jgi:putative ABC transport system substrate-binding protein
MVELRVGALVISVDGFFLGRREQIFALALRHSLPAIYHDRDFAAAV